jgi:hypothetical protein
MSSHYMTLAPVNAERAAKQHCSKGHRYHERNTYRRPNGTRACRTCIAARAADYRERKGL